MPTPDTLREYQATCDDVSLFDVSHHGKVAVIGADARSFLHNLCTNDVNKLPIGTGCEAFLTTSQAKIVAYVLIHHLPQQDGQEQFLLDVGPSLAEQVVKHLDRYLISERLEIIDRTHDLIELHIAGPRAREVLDLAAGQHIPELAELHHCSYALSSVSCHLFRHDPLGLPGYDLVCARHDAGKVRQELITAGATPAGLEAYNILRVEAGTPVFGVDINDTNLPQEVGRVEQTISFTKGCYIGQETVARIRTYGHVNRSLVGLKVAHGNLFSPGTKILRDGKEVGQITSCVTSPRVGMIIALAYVRRGSQEPGTKLDVNVEGGRQIAEVVPLPFIGSKGEAV
jgi:folate-binding protein YgfZ